MAGGSPASVGGRKQRSNLCTAGARNQQAAAGGPAMAGQRRRAVGCGAPGGSRSGAFTTTLARFLAYTALVCLVACGLLRALGVSGAPAGEEDAAANVAMQQLVADSKAALEAELSAILQQQELSQDTNSKLLSEAIISRLMRANITDNGQDGEANSESFEAPALVEPADEASFMSGLDAAQLRRMMNHLQNYQLAQTHLNAGHYPVLPAGQAATIKRASTKMSHYMRQQPHQRQLNGYVRTNSFDFGLGKRPDSSVSGNILRFGDSASAGSHMAAVSGSGLGKRPSARYDFGLGKRVASPAYPRYDFGLGKRAPSRVRYDFGLGK